MVSQPPPAATAEPRDASILSYPPDATWMQRVEGFVWPRTPEPLEEQDWRRVARWRVWIPLVMVAFNFAVYARFVGDPDLPVRVAAFERFLVISTTLHLSNAALSALMLIAPRSSRAWALATALSCALEMSAALAAVWIQGHLVRIQPFLVMLVAGYRFYYNAAIGLVALGFATVSHVALIVIALNGGIDLHPLDGAPESGLTFRAGPILIVWSVGCYLLTWVLANLGARRYRRSDALLRLTNRELREALAQVSILARTDALTGVLNRRAFDEQFEREVERAARFEHPLSLLLIDLDNFKRVNDTHGHQEGDRALQRLAQLLLANSRSTDVVARVGGEELAVVLPETTRAGAIDLAERLCTLQRDEGLHTTISIGVASREPGVDTCATLYEAADRSLYRAKRSGRDRVEA